LNKSGLEILLALRQKSIFLTRRAEIFNNTKFVVLFASLLLIVMVFAPTLPFGQAMKSDKTVFADSFEHKSATWFPQTTGVGELYGVGGIAPGGVWKVVDDGTGNHVFQASSDANNRGTATFAGDEQWTDYTVEAKVQTTDTWMGIIVRADSTGKNFYSCYISGGPGGGGAEIFKHYNGIWGRDSLAGESSSVPVYTNAWTDIKVEVSNTASGVLINLFYKPDGPQYAYSVAPQAQAFDTQNPYTLGKIGLIFYDNVGPPGSGKHAWFDDVLVTNGHVGGSLEVPWHVTADVVSFPWGQHDILGSDSASRLIVNRPSGTTEVDLTGLMGGLAPSSKYQVMIANGYEPWRKWSMTGLWTLQFNFGSGTDNYNLQITSQDSWGLISGIVVDSQSNNNIGSVTGTLTSLRAPARSTVALIISVNGYVITASGFVDYDVPTYSLTISGTYSDSNSNSGSWNTVSGQLHSIGTTGFPGQLATPVIYFVTDQFGKATWHWNLRSIDFPQSASGNLPISVWINLPPEQSQWSILASDSFTVSIG
jgi:hypothetical protein